MPWNDGTSATSLQVQQVYFPFALFGQKWQFTWFSFSQGLVSKHLRFCDRCMADQGANCCPRLDYRNIGPSAAWPLTSVSHETYMNLDSHCISPWQKMPGFHFRSISHDWMHHTYLGTARDLCGSGTFPFASFFFGGAVFHPKFLKLFILKLFVLGKQIWKF